MKTDSDLRPVGLFLVLLVLLSAPVDALSIHIGQSPAMLSRMNMWCPGVAAIMTCLVFRLPLSGLGWRLPSARFIAWGYFLPWLYAIPVYVVTWLLVSGAWDWAGYSAAQATTYGMTAHADVFAALFGIPSTLTFGVLSTVTWALGEELGWRGFLVPHLAGRLGTTGAGLAVGVIWAVWHYPILLGAGYNAGTDPVYAVACFTIMVIAMGIAQAWLRVWSGSVWPCVLVHASHNTLVQGVLDAMTSKTGKAPYITTEFGAGMAVTLTLVAGVTVLRGRNLRPR